MIREIYLTSEFGSSKPAHVQRSVRNLEMLIWHIHIIYIGVRLRLFDSGFWPTTGSLKTGDIKRKSQQQQMKFFATSFSVFEKNKV